MSSPACGGGASEAGGGGIAPPQSPPRPLRGHSPRKQGEITVAPRHSRAGGDPGRTERGVSGLWVPASAGMTKGWGFQHPLFPDAGRGPEPSSVALSESLGPGLRRERERSSGGEERPAALGPSTFPPLDGGEVAKRTNGREMDGWGGDRRAPALPPTRPGLCPAHPPHEGEGRVPSLLE